MNTEKAHNCFNQYALVILKPDVIELGLDNYFIRDLDYLGLKTVYRQLIRFLNDEIPFIYPELLDQPIIYDANLTYMTSGQSMILIVKSSFEYTGEDLHDYVKKCKGRANEPGLRRKYIRFFEEDLRRRHLDPSQFLAELVKNRIHSPENAADAYFTLNNLWLRLDRNKIKEYAPPLYDILSESRRIEKYDK